MFTGNVLNLYQHEDGYRYNSDSLLLYNFISNFKLHGKLLDVGSGCGIVGLLLKRDFKDISLSQIELQKSHFEMNEKSALENKIEVELINDDFLTHAFKEKFDFIVSNPPFYDMGSKKSENLSLTISRYADNLPLAQFFKKVSQIIKPRGSFLFCYDAKQIDAVLFELKNYKLKLEHIQFVHTKVSKDANLMLIHAKKSSKSLTKVMSPLIVHNTDGTLSEYVNSIYEKSQTKSKVWKN